MDLSALRRLISARFSRAEFKPLCRDLQERLEHVTPASDLLVRADDLAGEGVSYEELIDLLLDRLRRHDRLAELRALLRERRPELDAAFDSLPSTIPPSTEAACPYPGLDAFGDDGQFPFFGRETEIRDALGLLWQGRFLAVVGRTGSGKSSLVMAGMVPALQRERGQRCVYCRPGTDPLAALTDARSRLASADHYLVVDQFEEVFGSSRAVVRDFSTHVGDIVGRHNVILTARADFYPDLMELPLWPLIRHHRLEVLPLEGDRLRDALREPAAARGVTVDPALVERIVYDAAQEPGSLPLVQVVMQQQLWPSRRDGRIPKEAYEELGGLRAAFARCADDAYREIERTWTDDQGPRQSALVRRIFVRLVDVVRPGVDTRRPQTVAELRGDDPAESFRRVLEHFIARRLLTSSGSLPSDSGARDPGDDGRRIDLAHDCLITAWPRLRDWLTEVRDVERRLRDLGEKAAAWRQAEAEDESLRGLLDRYEVAAGERTVASAAALDLGPGTDVERFVEASRLELVRQEQEADAARHRELQLESDRREAAEREAEAQRLLAEKAGEVAAAHVARTAASRRSNLAMQILGLTIGALFWAAVYGWYQQRIATQFRLAGVAQTLAAQAITRAADHDVDQAMLLARQAWSIDRSAEQRAHVLVHEALQATIGHPGRLRLLPLGPDRDRPASAVALSPDDRTMAAGDAKGHLYLIDWRQPAAWKPALAHEKATMTGAVATLAFGADGRSVIALDEFGQLRRFLIQDGRLTAVQSFQVPPPTTQPVVAAGASLIAGAWDGRARIFRRAGDPVETLKIDHVVDLALAPNERQIAIAAEAGVAIVDPVSSRLEWLTRNTSTRVAFSRDGSTLLSGSRANGRHLSEVKRWRIDNGSWVEDAAGTRASNLADANTNLLGMGLTTEAWLVTRRGPAYDDPRLRVAAGGLHAEIASIPSQVSFGHVSARGEVVAALTATGLALWETGAADGERVALVSGEVADLHWSADTLYGSSALDPRMDVGVYLDAPTFWWAWQPGHLLPVSITGANLGRPLRIRARNSTLRTLTGRVLEDFPASKEDPRIVFAWSARRYFPMAIDNRGDTVVSCEDPAKAAVRRFNDTDLVRTESIDMDKGACSAVGASDNGQVVVTGTEQGAVSVWRWKNNRFDREDLVTRVLGETVSPKPVTSLYLDASAGRLVAGYPDGSVLLWEFGPLTIGPSRLSDPEFKGTVAALSRDGRWLATGGVSGTIRLWNLLHQSARPPVLRTMSSDRITALTFSDDGQYLFVGDSSGTVQRWLTSTDRLADLVCERAWRNLSMTEWRQFVGDDLPYSCTCPGLPPGDGAPGCTAK